MPEKHYWGYNSIGVNSMGSIMATVVLASTVITCKSIYISLKTVIFVLDSCIAQQVCQVL